MRWHLAIAGLFLACLALGGAISVALGQDANWDLLNYHLYNGVALLNGRFQQDLVPAGLQSYLNPLLDAVYAWLALGPLQTYPRWLSAAAGLWFGVAIFFAARLAVLMHPGRPLAIATAVLVAVSGVAMVSQIGTTTGEVPAAAIMLGGLYWLFYGAQRGPPSAVTVLLAGVLFGTAAGLKLTASVYAPALCLAAASLYRPRDMLRAGAACICGWLVGFAVVDGWWALALYRRFESPTFPMFNGVFRSPWFPPATLFDDRFRPHGLQWLLYPFEWLARGPEDASSRDPRAVLVLCAAVAAGLAGVFRRGTALSPIQRAACVFLATGYAAWLASSAIYRYAVVLEIMAGLVAPFLLARVLRGRALSGGLVLAAAATLVLTRYPQTLRVPYGPLSLQSDGDWLEPGTLIAVTFRGPSAHVIATLPHQASLSVVNVGDTVLEARGWPLHDEMLRRVRSQAGPIVVITQGNVPGRFPELGEIGIDPVLADCRAIRTTFLPTGLFACTGHRRDVPHLPSPFWAQAARHYRTLIQPAEPTQALFGATYLETVGPAARGTRFIDWTDLLWRGVRNAGAPLPQALDPGALYVLAPEHVRAVTALLGPTDVLGRVDGVIVVAPGWRGCSDCTATLDPVPIVDLADALPIGDIVRLGAQAAVHAQSDAVERVKK